MTNKTDEVLIPETKEAIVGEEKFEIAPLVRAQYKKLINVLAELAMQIDAKKLEDIGENAENTKYMINLISDEALMELYEVALDRKKKWINNNMYIHQEVDLILKIVEVNNVEKIIENFIIAVKKKKVIQKLTEQFQNTQ